MLGRTFAFLMTSTAPPAIASANYTQGDTLGGGQPIVLTGSGFIGATSVDFGASTASFTVDSDTRITATLPAHAAGSVSITVTGPRGTSGGLAFEFWDPTLLTSETAVFEDYRGSPWVARGGSHGGSLLLNGTGVTVGAGAGGFSSADSPGTGAGALTSAAPDYIEDYISYQGSGTSTAIWVIFKARTAALDNGSAAPYANPGLVVSAPGYIGTNYSTAGFVFGCYDGTSWLGVSVHAAVGSWHLGVGEADGTNIYASVDGSALSANSVAHGLVAAPGLNSWFLQSNNRYENGASVDGEILAFGVAKSGFGSDAEVGKLRAWANQRFGVGI